MEQKFIDNWQSYGKTALEAAKELEAINSQVFEKITDKQIELANSALEAGSRYFATVTEAKDYSKLLADHTRLAAEFNEKLLEAARGTTTIIAESRDAYQAWVEKGLKAFTANSDLVLPSFLNVARPAKKAA